MTSIKDSFKSCEMRFSLAVIPLTQCSTKEELASDRRRIEWSRLRIRTGLKTFSWVLVQGDKRGLLGGGGNTEGNG